MFRKTCLLLLIQFVFITTFGQQANDITMLTGSPKQVSRIETPEAIVYEFNAISREYELNLITDEQAGEHFLGNQIARKIYLLNSRYTKEVELVPGNPQTRTVIQKPIIYETVKKIERELKKNIRKGEITTEIAKQNLNTVLDIALNVLNTDTIMFEKTIESLPDTKARLELFLKHVRLNY